MQKKYSAIQFVWLISVLHSFYVVNPGVSGVLVLIHEEICTNAVGEARCAHPTEHVF